MSRRSLRDERGGILVMAAVMIPVFLLLTALVLDVGNWLTHKRQLQNRADAAAFAAGIEYGKNWKACVQNGDAALKLTTAQEIADAARQYAGNPEAADYAGGTLPTLQNTEIANQANLDVMINSPDYTDDNDFNDYGGTGRLGDPCYPHAGDDVSPGGGHWTDVKVKERDLPSIVGSVGLPLANNYARARIEIRPALSGRRFLPLSVPNNVITKVQIRYYNECVDPNHTGTPLTVRDLAPLPEADQVAYNSAGQGTLWGLPSGGDPDVGDKNLSFVLSVPQYDPSCGEYVPIGVQVRLTSQDDIDINAACSTLQASDFADCFSRASQFRVYNDGNADSQPRITQVRILGGCGGIGGDPYFGVSRVGSNTCPYGVSAEINWGSRDDGLKNVPENFTVTANGAPMTLVSSPTGDQSGTWSTNGTPRTASPGATNIQISLSWEDTDPTHTWGGNQCGGGNNPCRYSGSPLTHRLFIGQDDDPSQAATYTGALELVRTGASPFVSNLPGPPFDNHRSGGGPSDCNDSDACTIFPTVGIRSVLKAGYLTTLRLRESQGNQLLKCDPTYDNNGQEFSLFQYGCSPWYGINDYTDTNWWGNFGQPGKSCPPSNLWFGSGNMPSPYGTNSSANFWKCVKASPGLSTPLVGEGLSVATDNCSRINNNQCQQTNCLVPGNYDGRLAGDGLPANPVGWLQRGGDSRDPRVINLFIIPYQALKTTRGGNAEQVVPVIGFASFYVMNWTGSNNQNSDPCPDRTYGGDAVPDPPAGAATGVFVEAVDYEPGPVDPNATCIEGQLTPCRVTLVR